MSHLGHWLSAQVDGELDGVERDRVLNHIAGCSACRDEANALRALKRRMTAFGDSAGSNGIASRLMELARADADVTAPAAPAAPVPAGLGSRQPRLTWRVATGSAGSVLLAIGVIAFLLGGGSGGGGPALRDRPVPKVTPAVDAYWTEHIYDTGQLPGTPARSKQEVLPVSGVSSPGPFAQFGPGAINSASPVAPASPATSAPPAGGEAHHKILIRLVAP